MIQTSEGKTQVEGNREDVLTDYSMITRALIKIGFTGGEIGTAIGLAIGGEKA